MSLSTVVMETSTCSIDGCDVQGPLRRGLCDHHYGYHRYHGTLPDKKPRAWKTLGVCSVEGCDRIARTKGVCASHYDRLRRTGDPGPAEVVSKPLVLCAEEGCTRPYYARTVCFTHYMYRRRHGTLPAKETPTNWKGDDVGYRAAHARVVRAKGRASDHMCPCGKQAVHWAYLHNDPNERWIEVRNQYKSGLMAYSANPEYFAARCRRCHIKGDQAAAKARAESRDPAAAFMMATA